MATATVEKQVERLDERVEWLEKINKLVTKEDFNVRIDAFERCLNTDMDNLINNQKNNMENLSKTINVNLENAENNMSTNMDALETNLRGEMKTLNGRMTFMQWTMMLGMAGLGVLIAIGTGMFN